MSDILTHRPNFDSSIYLSVAKKLLPQVVQWAAEQGPSEILERELSDAISRCSPRFGVEEIAHYLEKRYLWKNDLELMDELYEVSTLAYEFRSQAVAAWVKANGIRPTKSVGDIVEVPPMDTDTGDSRYKGQIISIDEEQGTYKVFVPDRGHVRSGFGLQGQYLPYEVVQGLDTLALRHTSSPD